MPVVRPDVPETTALGAAYLAGLAIGYWQQRRRARANWQVDRRFEPAMPRERVAESTRRLGEGGGEVEGMGNRLIG